MRYEESIASRLIERVVPGARMIHAASEEDGQCDFTLSVGGRHFPLEVTAFTRERVRRQLARLAGPDGCGHFVDRALAAHDWWVILSHRSDPQEVRKRIDVHLHSIEKEGRSKFSIGLDVEHSAAVKALWEDLWVTDGTRMPWNPPGRIGLAGPGDGGLLASDQVTAAIEREAAKADNLRKLSQPADERHLFVYIDWHGYPAHSVMLNGMLPSGFPAIAETITHIWAAAPAGTGDQHVLWAADRVDGWRDHGIIDPAKMGGD